MYKTIRIPHLGFAVYIRPKPKEWTSYASTLFSKDGYSVKLYLPDRCTTSALAHELVHVLQALSRKYNMDFDNEDEHFAYIMQWLMEEVQGAQRKARKKRAKGRKRQ